MTLLEIDEWYAVPINIQLFSPTNRRPTSQQQKEVFEIANHFEPGQHKPSSCGRCYASALKTIKKYI